MTNEHNERMSDMEVSEIKKLVEAESERIAKQGEWPAYKLPFAVESIAGRIPNAGETNGQGFDAGVASALDLIPRDKQRLASVLHANYSPEAVEQVKRELKELDPNSETAWWLAACSLCKEGGIDQNAFKEQVKKFEDLAADDKARGEAAKAEYAHMSSLFSTEKYNFPYGETDGAIQGAYIAGYPAASNFSKEYGIYFVGTYMPSLGLEDFEWSKEVDEKDRPKSGPVHGSKQFVKCSSEEEFKKVLEVVKKHLKMEN